MLQDYGDYTLPLAISIVMSGQYEDNLDKYEEIVYTGQGGNNLLGDKHQMKDQVMKRGNLALKVINGCFFQHFLLSFTTIVLINYWFIVVVAVIVNEISS